MSTKALLHLIGTDRTKEEILKLADKVVLFNGVNKKE